MDNREIGRDTPYTRPAKFNMKAFMALVRQTKPAYWQLALGLGLVWLQRAFNWPYRI